MASTGPEDIEQMSNKQADSSSTALSPRRGCGCFSRTASILVGLGVTCIAALAIGLGMGLTLGRSGGGDVSSATETSGPITTPTGHVNSGNSNIWQSSVGNTWQIVLQDPITVSSANLDPDVSVWDIDLFTNSRETIDMLHNKGKKVICYFSAGSYEPYRPDSSEFAASDKGKAIDGWPDEKWVNVRSQGVREIMAARIRLASDKGCDGVDPDNVDAYNNNNGLSLTEEDAISFVRFLANEATSHSLAIGLKNAGEILSSVISVVQFSVNEQCVEYSECGSFAPMIGAGKPVFHIEYPKGAPGGVSQQALQQACTTTGDGAGSEGFSTALKGLELGGWVEFCDGSVTGRSMLVP